MFIPVLVITTTFAVLVTLKPILEFATMLILLLPLACGPIKLPPEMLPVVEILLAPAAKSPTIVPPVIVPVVVIALEPAAIVPIKLLARKLP